MALVHRSASILLIHPHSPSCHPEPAKDLWMIYKYSYLGVTNVGHAFGLSVGRLYMLFPVGVRRHPHHLGKHPRKIIRIVNTQLIGNFLYAKLCEQQVLTGLLYLQVVEIFDRCKPGLPFK